MVRIRITLARRNNLSSHATQYGNAMVELVIFALLLTAVGGKCLARLESNPDEFGACREGNTICFAFLFEGKYDATLPFAVYICDSFGRTGADYAPLFVHLCNRIRAVCEPTGR